MSDPVCVIGDSVSGGVIMNEETGRYTHYPDSFINLLSRELGFELHNRSKFGCTAPAALARLDRFESDISSSNHTLVMLGGNDSDFDWPRVAETPEVWHDCNTPIEKFVEAYEALLDRLLVLGTNPVIINMIPVDGEGYFNWFSQKSDPASLLRFLHRTESIEHWNEMFNLAIMGIAARRGLPFLDARSAFLRAKFFDGLFSRDGIHPSPAGHRALFDYLLPQAR
ncbi:MAG: SGNH/GDSL hydrolase family protein, partial [Oscillospiraceae bacterium]